MTDRIRLDDLTSAQLDQLYADLDRYEEVQGEMNENAIDLTRRAARAEAAIARVRSIPRLPHSSQQTGELGRAYTRGWESVISAIDTALDEPKEG